MKKTAAKIKVNANDFFNKNIGILGLIVVILFFTVYLLLQKLNKLENQVVKMEAKDTTEASVMPVVDTKSNGNLKK